MGSVDVAIVGGGIVGLATARALLTCGLRVVVLEKEQRLASHQTGHNSGVIHSGLYYKPGSHKARNCTRGRELMIRFCEEQNVPFERCGKIVVATRDEQLPQLAELERRGLANGLAGVRRLTSTQLVEHEPNVRGVAGLHVPQTAIVDYGLVALALARDLESRGARLHTRARVLSIAHRDGRKVVETEAGDFDCRVLVNCAGLHSDRIARLCGVDPQVRIVPFRGEYFELTAASATLVKSLVYPVPDPAFPFLGVHFTRRMTADRRHAVEAGPNAVLALEREGYHKGSFSIGDAWSSLGYRGFWKMASRHWQTGLGEVWRSWNKAAFARALAELVPALKASDLVPGGSGVRAQALLATGMLVDDFHVIEAPQMVHVLNAPSPAATASLAIGETVAARAAAQLGLANAISSGS